MRFLFFAMFIACRPSADDIFEEKCQQICDPKYTHDKGNWEKECLSSCRSHFIIGEDAESNARNLFRKMHSSTLKEDNSYKSGK